MGLLADAGAVLVTAIRLLTRHWPALLAIFLGGALARELAIQAAVRSSLFHATLGTLVLLLAPMATLTALVLMLRTVRPSLPTLAGQGAPPPVLEHLGAVLLPFLTIYYFEDYLYEDISSYDYRVVEDDTQRSFAQILDDNPETIDTAARLPYDLTVTMAAVVVTAIVARWLLSQWQVTQRHKWLGIPGAYLELVWLTLVYLAFMEVADWILDWGSNRRLTQALRSGWEEVVGAVAGLADPFQGTTDWVGAQLGQLNAVLLVPLAWLAIGAVVLGHQPAARLERVVDRAGGRQLYQHASRRWSAAPRAMQWLAKKVTADLRGRFTPLAQGARMLVRGGVAPMLLFCLAFVAARSLEDWLWQLQRLLIGPQDVWGVWVPLAWPLNELNRGITYTVVICLLAAAVERALRPQRDAAQSTGNQA